MTDHRKRELGAFLRARRERLKPQDVGLAPVAGRRRTPGLRREEVAQLSGVGLTWYTWLEQGRDIPSSRQVIEALATALRLDDDDRDHIFELAGLRAAEPRSPDGELPALVQRVLDNLMPNPAYVFDQRLDILAWNRAQALLWLDPGTVEPAERNLLWLIFTDPLVRSLLVDWESAAGSVLGQFRAAAGRSSGDHRYAEIANRLREVSPEFGKRWDSYPVAEFDVEVNRLDHPGVGRIDLDLLHLRLVEHPTLTVVLQTPVGPVDSARIATLLDRSG
ncbi:helix-turn-helix protein [Saccharothrix saharensis]|uniref:Helix-turn-helix protein n=1 Tax=Saccharothrix saharensis TaxID=571190 RepID=A0A543JAH9_9PSEU|nr:helix-turn-helix transcriptional regulator [Saccharothrix saharensis]TQM79833.1 helix-turn-helix protein [Saccharothrix saharensis]